LVGKSPKLVAIDGGAFHYQRDRAPHLISKSILGVGQSTQTGFQFNGESNLDLQYAMNLVNLKGSKQEVTLYQVGDIPQGVYFISITFAVVYSTFLLH
jgi:tripeptidyl-peptidase-1